MALHISKPLYFCVTPVNKSDFGQILRQQCIIYWQSKSQTLVKVINANNSHNDFYEVTPKCEVSSIKQLFV